MAGPFQEYPKLMKHPDHKAAVWRQLEGKGTGLFVPDTVLVTPEKLPDVTVVNKSQEQQYAARGYRPTNVANAAEYEQAILEQAPVTGYLDVEYPKWKYHAMQIPKLVNSKAEEDALGAGWSNVPVIATEDDLAAVEQ